MTAHYFKTNEADPLRATKDVTLMVRNVFLIQHEGPESASYLRKAFDNVLKDQYEISLDQLTENFTFVTDCAATMPKIVGASSSSSRIPFSEKCLGCVSHMLNTAMKHAINEEKSDSIVYRDLNTVKTIVRIFKQGNWNDALPHGCKLVQEVETRFGTHFQVVERFLKSVEHVGRIIGEKESQSATESFQKFECVTVDLGNTIYPALEAIATCFAPICHVQKQLEASDTCTINLVLPLLEQLDAQLTQISNSMMRSDTFFCPVK